MSPLAHVILAALLSPPAEVAPSAGRDYFPAEVEAVASPVTDEGSFVLRLACTPAEDFSRRFALRVALSSDFSDLSTTEHELAPSTKRWRAGKRVEIAVPLQLPFDQDLVPDEYLFVRIGFVPEGGGDVRPLGGVWADLADSDDLVEVAVVRVPQFAGPPGRQRLTEVLERAKALRAAKDVAGAWNWVVRALRAAADDSTKETLRNALAEVGRLEPARPTPVEELIVGQRIRSEQVRFFRLESGRMYGRGELHGALRLLERIGGALAVSADEEVIGALGDVERVTKSIDDLRERLLTEITAEEGARLAELVELHGRTKKLLKAADKHARHEGYPLALALYRKLRRVDGIELYDEAQVRLDEVGASYLAATPPDQAEKVRAVIEHPAWERTTVVAAHSFLYIGPKQLVEQIPDDSKLRFDLAYVFVTDLFGRVPNPAGDRLTVYFKELWDFGGGVGGGKIIDIGRADPAPQNPVRVDNGLLYHELTHCVDDTRPIHAGFREGLANLGAAYTHEALDQDGSALHSFESNLASFERYFLERDLEYWRIQNYGPSAGLFLHFVDTYASVKGGGHDWSPLRRFFREYRDAPVRDGREPYVARALAHYLVRAFGPHAFDDLVAFGFPLEKPDRRLLSLELDTFEGGVDLEPFRDRFSDYPNAQLPRDAVQRELSTAAGRKNLDHAADVRRELGVIFDWKVIGPFFAKQADPGAHPFVPEDEIDFRVKPLTWRASKADRTQRSWQSPPFSWVPSRSHRNVVLYPTGWLRFDYRPYGDDNSAIYALTHITVPEAVAADVHIRADDDFTLFVNDRRIGSYRGWGSNGSSNLNWRGPYENAPDATRFRAKLEAGRNKVLIKIRNRGGPAGLVAAFSRTDGSTLEFEADADPPSEPGPRTPVAEPEWKRVVTLDHRSFSSKTIPIVGSFRAGNKAFHGTSTERGVGWRLFTVRPGFPKDSPSNLLWLRPSLTDRLDSLRVDVALTSPKPPKLLVTFQGEGDTDGLSGWNLILTPSGTNAVQARLERYDRLVYHSDPVELPEATGDRVISLRYWDGWCSASIDGAVLFDRLSIHPIPARHRIGLATWGPEPEIRSIELSRGR